MSEPDRKSVEGMCSIVVPMYNEEGAVKEFHQRVTAVMKTTGRDYEIVFVNDGSTDGTLDLLKEVAAGDPHVVVIEFRRNFGQTPGLQAGFDYSRGDIVIAMDGDLENVPEDIPKFLEHIDEGYDIVLQLSPDAAFGTAANIVDQCDLHLGADGVKRTDSDKDDIVGRYIVPFCNERAGTTYRYARLYTVVVGTIATGINYTGRMSKS